MATTPTSVLVPIRMPLYIQAPSGDFIEVGAAETSVVVTVEAAR